MQVYGEPKRQYKKPELKGAKGLLNRKLKPVLFQVPANVPLREVSWTPHKKVRSGFWGGLFGLVLLGLETLIDVPGLVPGWLEPVIPMLTGLIASYRRSL